MNVPRLSIRGINKDGGNPTDNFDWGDAIIDAGIMAGISFFATLTGSGAGGLGGLKLIASALIAAGTTFCTILAIKRKLVEGK
jgi:hypothetical protein